MSFGTFLDLVLMSGVLGFGQWMFFRVFNNGRRSEFLPLFGSLLLTQIALFLIRGMLK